MSKLEEIDPDKIYNLKEVSEILTLSVSTLREKCRSKTIPHLLMCRSFKIVGKDIIEFVNKSKVDVI